MQNGVVPLRRSEVDLRLDSLPAARSHIDQLKSANPRALHPFEILGDAALGHIAIGPMPPRARLRRVRRRMETLLQWIAALRCTRGASVLSKRCTCSQQSQ